MIENFVKNRSVMIIYEATAIIPIYRRNNFLLIVNLQVWLFHQDMAMLSFICLQTLAVFVWNCCRFWCNSGATKECTFNMIIKLIRIIRIGHRKCLGTLNKYMRSVGESSQKFSFHCGKAFWLNFDLGMLPMSNISENSQLISMKKVSKGSL